jgi:hypothetical protein
VQLDVDDFKKVIEQLKSAGDTEAAIAAQLALDLALSNDAGAYASNDDVLTLLKLRLARHRAQVYPASDTIH